MNTVPASAPLLIVEDDPVQIALMQRALQKLSLPIASVDDGQQAIVWLQVNQPAVIILDMLLPILSGEEVLEYIYGAAHLANTRVLVMSAQEQYRRLQLRPGDYFLPKPYNITDVFSRVETLLRDAGLL